MIVTHSFNKKSISKDVHDSGFLLSNRSGSFFSYSNDPRHRGLFININGRTFKTIDMITTPGKIRELKNNLWNVQVHKKRTKEEFFMPMHTNTLVYETDSYEKIELLLDFKKISDNRNWGKDYRIKLEDKKIIVRFTKTSDPRDGDKDKHKEFELFMVIEGDKNLHFKENSEWIRQKDGNYIFNSMTLLSRILVISVSDDKKKAIQSADHVFRNLDHLKKIQHNYHTLKPKKNIEQEIEFAMQCASGSLDSHISDDSKKIISGFPTDPKEKQREEALSLKALIIEKELDTAKNILVQHLTRLKEKKDTSDLAGWHFIRWNDMIDAIVKHDSVDDYFTNKEMEEISEKINGIMNYLLRNNTDRNGLATTSLNNTWMDTIQRNGARIELQALRLAVLDLLYKLTGNEEYKHMEIRLKKTVKKYFWNGAYLFDGDQDPTIRPNIFIAAYAYPDMLSRTEWESCFDKVLKHLWLPYGALSTIDIKNDYYQPNAKKADNDFSGKSWYWLNNMAATVMHRINKRKYRKYIHRIIENSCEEILWSGFCGHHAEMSSEHQQSLGNLTHSAAAAMFLELMDEVYKPKRIIRF